MGVNMWKNDPYDIRKFEHEDIASFVDIGANQGLATLTAFGSWYDANCRYIMIEPFPLTYEGAKKHLGEWVFRMGGEIHNCALGNNETLYFIGGKFHGMYEFVTQKEYEAFEAKWGRESFKTTDEFLRTEVQSYSLPALFSKFKIDRTKEYYVKIDCEGGERFIFDDPEAVSILQGAAQVAMEVHYKHGLTAETFVKFCHKMSETHIVRRTIQERNEDGSKGGTLHCIIEPKELERLLAHPNAAKWCSSVWKSLTEATFVRKDWAKKRVSSNETRFVNEAWTQSWPVGDVLTGKNVGK